MNRILFFISLSILVSLISWNDSYADDSDRKFTISIQVSQGYSSFLIDSDFHPDRSLREKRTDHRTDFNIYFVFERPISNYLNLLISPGLVHRGAFDNFSVNWPEFSTQNEYLYYRFNYISLPVLLQIAMPTEWDVNPFIEIGPRIDFRTHGHIEIYTNRETFGGPPVPEYQVSLKYARMIYGASFGIGFQEKITDRTFRGGVRMNLDLHKSYKETNHEIRNVNAEIYFSFGI